MILFALFFGAFWVCQLAAGWRIASEDGNVGFLLIAGLPLAVFAAILLQFASGCPTAEIYLQDTSFAGHAVFLIWGFGVGYCINFALAMLKVEPPRPVAVAAWYVGGVLVAFLYLFLLSGTPAQPLAAIWEAAQPTIWTTWFLWSLGFLLGFVRPLEGIYYLLRPQPNTSRWTRARVWSTPGATLVPSYRVRHALGAWLEQDWHKGVQAWRRRSPLPHASSGRSSRRSARRLGRRAPTTCRRDYATVCDSGATCALDMVKPPHMIRPGPAERRGRKRKCSAPTASGACLPRGRQRTGSGPCCRASYPRTHR